MAHTNSFQKALVLVDTLINMSDIRGAGTAERAVASIGMSLRAAILDAEYEATKPAPGADAASVEEDD